MVDAAQSCRTSMRAARPPPTCMSFNMRVCVRVRASCTMGERGEGRGRGEKGRRGEGERGVPPLSKTASEPSPCKPQPRPKHPCMALPLPFPVRCPSPAPSVPSQRPVAPLTAPTPCPPALGGAAVRNESTCEGCASAKRGLSVRACRPRRTTPGSCVRAVLPCPRSDVGSVATHADDLRQRGPSLPHSGCSTRQGVPMSKTAISACLRELVASVGSPPPAPRLPRPRRSIPRLLSPLPFRMLGSVPSLPLPAGRREECAGCARSAPRACVWVRAWHAPPTDHRAGLAPPCPLPQAA